LLANGNRDCHPETHIFFSVSMCERSRLFCAFTLHIYNRFLVHRLAKFTKVRMYLPQVLEYLQLVPNSCQLPERMKKRHSHRAHTLRYGNIRCLLSLKSFLTLLAFISFKSILLPKGEIIERW
jgi:hypothetical protein